MFSKIIRSFNLALSNIRARLVHTFLSVLGIVIGVGALVAILSMIDGMEQYATSQVANTTDFNMLAIRSQTTKEVNGIRVTKDSVPYLDYQKLMALQKACSKPFKAAYISTYKSLEVSEAGQDSTYGVVVAGTGHNAGTMDSLIAGRMFVVSEIENAASLAVINLDFANALSGDSVQAEKALGKQIVVQGKTLEVIGVVGKSKRKHLTLAMPITHYDSSYLASNHPRAAIIATTIEDVSQIKKEAEEWLAKEFPKAKDAFVISTDKNRVAQIEKGFLVFRIVMGLIVGISVIVGGIGIMNVLLISVTERTSEIGVRKALGANRKDITMQFLAEAITVSLFGSSLGLLLGMGFTAVAVPIIRKFSEMPFQAAYTWQMLLTVGIIAVIVGVVFGTYPAIRASRLDPVEAIRRE